LRSGTQPVVLPQRMPPVALIAATTLAVGAVGGLLIARSQSAEPSNPPTISAPVERPEMLIVTTRPPGATVVLDGKPLPEITPTAVRGIAIGQHALKITHRGYGVVDRPVAIAAGERASLDIRLPSESRQIRVRSIPAGASVFLENQLVSSTTPAEITVKSDDFYTVRVEKLGYEPYIKNITPDDSETELELQLDEEKHPMGYLWIDTNNTGEVWIDGIDTGYTAPTFGLRVAVGDHTVELRDSSGAHSKTLKLKVAQGESKHVILDISVRK
jgi:hypothetical protein